MKTTRKLNKRWLLAGLIIASFVIALLGPGFSGRFRSYVEWVYVPIGDPVMWLATTVRSSISGDSDEANKREHILRHERDQAYSTLDEFLRQYYGEQDFRELYGLSLDSPIELMPARVVSADSLVYGSTRLLNIGRNKGAMPGLKVTERIILTTQKEPMRNDLLAVTSSSLVGQIIHAGPFTAKLQLITDPGFRINARIIRSLDRERYFISTKEDDAGERLLTDTNNWPVKVKAQGDGKGGLIISNISDDHRIMAGDSLITSNDDVLMPIEVRIGTVSNVEKDPRHPGFVTITIKPDADMDSLRYVYVVVSRAGKFLKKTLSGGQN